MKKPIGPAFGAAALAAACLCFSSSDVVFGRGFFDKTKVAASTPQESAALQLQKAIGDKPMKPLQGEVGVIGGACDTAGVELESFKTPTVVTSVRPNSPAFYANVGVNDKVLSLNVQKEVIHLVVERGGKEYNVQIDLTPEGMSRQAAIARRVAQRPAVMKPFDLKISTDIVLPATKADLQPVRFALQDGKQGWITHLPQWTPDKVLPAWAVKTRSQILVPTPAVLDGRVFVGGGIGSMEMYSLDAKTGRLIWRTQTRDNGPSCATVVDRYVLFNTESCTVYCVDAATGKVVWQQFLAQHLQTQPAVSNGRVYVTFMGDKKQWTDHHQTPVDTAGLAPEAAFQRRYRLREPNTLLCADVRTGQPLWDIPLQANALTTPVVDNGYVYVTCSDGTITCANATNGSVYWTKAATTECAPLVVHGQVLTGVSELTPDMKRMAAELAVKPSAPQQNANRNDDDQDNSDWYLTQRQRAQKDRDKRLQERALRDAQDDYERQHSGDATTQGLHMLKISGWSSENARPVFVKGMMIRSKANVVDAVDPRSGHVYWSTALPVKPLCEELAYPWRDREVLSAPAFGAKNVYFTSMDGHIASLRIADGGINYCYATGQPIFFQPSLVNGNVYVGTGNGYVISFTDPDAVGWNQWGGNPEKNRSN